MHVSDAYPFNPDNKDDKKGRRFLSRKYTFR
jgi:hypothetical protein